jgi:hypothetical protein
MMGWVDTILTWLTRLIGTLELFGFAGLVLPPLTGIALVFEGRGRDRFSGAPGGRHGLQLSCGEVKEMGLNIMPIMINAVVAWLAMTR